jgi:predicted CXXCH cytochrome family protein
MPGSERHRLIRAARQGGLRLAAAGAIALVLSGAGAPIRAQVRPVTTRPAATRPATRPATKAPNPHWTTTDCQACHERAAGGEVKPIELTRVNALCWTCHDGKQAHQEVHPVARRFAGTDMVAPAGWPIPNGELSCVTCHDFGSGHAKGGPRPERNAWMLRGYTGGSLTPFCAKCHVSSPAHKPFNPHLMLDEKGSPNLRNCLLCHQETSDVLGRKTRTGKPDLQADEVSLCVRCHTRHVDYFEPGHIGVEVPPKIKAYMLAREAQGMQGEVSAGQIEAFMGQPGSPQRLPLGRGGRAVCSTCHNPHQEGLFPPESPLGMGGMRVHVKNRPPEMRGLGKEICRGCHNQ